MKGFLIWLQGPYRYLRAQLTGKWRYLWLGPLLLAFLYILYFIFCFQTTDFSPMGDVDYAFTPRMGALFVCCLAILAFLVALIIVLAVRKKLTTRIVSMAFLTIGFMAVIYLCFLNSQNYWSYNHDYGWNADWGHWDVILEAFRTWSIPAPHLNGNGTYNLTDQFYQPKLYHLLMAYFMKFNGQFVSVGDTIVLPIFGYTQTEYVLMDMNRIAQAWIGCMILCVSHNVLKEFKLRPLVVTLATGIVVFLPAMWFINIYGNNDALALLLSLSALLFTLRWMKNRSYFDIVMMALSIGLGMATKLNSGLIAIYVAGIFIYELVLLYKRKSPRDQIPHDAVKYRLEPRKTFWVQIAVFAAIVFPLGLYFSISMFVKYGEPFGYVWDLGTGSRQYIDPAAYPFWERFLVFPAGDLFWSYGPFNLHDMAIINNHYVAVWGTQDFNCWDTLIKTALFDEWNLANGNTVVWVACWIAEIVLSLIVFFTLFGGLCMLVLKCLDKWKGNRFKAISMISLVAIHAIAYAYFCYRYPYGCTMSIRYCAIIVVPLAAVFGQIIAELGDGLGWLEKRSAEKKAALKNHPA